MNLDAGLERRAVWALITHPRFRNRFARHIAEDVFLDLSSAIVFAAYTRLSDGFTVQPSIEFLASESESIITTGHYPEPEIIMSGVVEILAMLYRAISDDDEIILAEHFTRYLQWRFMSMSWAARSDEIIRGEGLDGMMRDIQRFATIGVADEVTTHFDTLDVRENRRMNLDTTGWIGTGLEPIDRMYGGRGVPREYTMIVGPKSFGKSFLVTNMGVGALVTGNRVLHISNENSIHEAGNRYDAILTGAPLNGLTRMRVAEAIQQSATLSDMSARLIIKDLSGTDASPDAIRALIHAYSARGMRPDLVIVDLFDNCSVPNMRPEMMIMNQDSVSKGFLDITIDEDVALTAVTHFNRGCEGKKFPSAKDIGGSYRAKSMIPHTSFFIYGSREDRGQGLIHLRCDRCRNHEVTWNMYNGVTLRFRSSHGTFHPVHGVDSVQGPQQAPRPNQTAPPGSRGPGASPRSVGGVPVNA